MIMIPNSMNNFNYVCSVCMCVCVCVERQEEFSIYTCCDHCAEWRQVLSESSLVLLL